MATRIIEEQRQKCGYKTDSDVSELYLGRQGLKEVSDLTRFSMLKYLWLNHNKITRIHFLWNNFRLSELYLNNNGLCDITDLFHNPLDQDPGYRPYVIHHLPSVLLLDRESVAPKEKEDAFKLYNLERTAVIQSLGFGRRTDSILGTRPFVHSAAVGASSQAARESGSTCLWRGDRDRTCNPKRKDLNAFEDKVLLRAYQRSIMHYTLLDWSKIPSLNHKGTDEQPKELPKLITVEFR
ncbi:leucine-rich repeat-containing protein 72 isoform X3 [Mixophyes fleayi]|uniref:leucine-rich repeat-containing protein 72 isoform X3 n=1 Tax=Mixophyes fleayi TaxID=3061075 RepID=UPI003F4DF446